MKRILLFACIACAAIVLTGCEKSYSSGTVTFFGNVVDADTGLPLPVAQINIYGGVYDNITAVSTVTGSDGTYEVNVTLPAGEEKSFNLYISVSKKGYFENSHSFSVTRDMVGKRIQQSFTIRK
ncbi:MAG: hypothetical protein IKP02_01930 [Paludibacteraceae bacterium]|nr:hypothetical protein [Paludibacteraceae bacterium]